MKRLGWLVFPIAAAITPASNAASAGAGVNFYCVEEHRIDAARLSDPAYRVSPSFTENASPQSIAMEVDFAFHNGLFMHSYAGNSHWVRNVTGRRVGGAVEYRGSKGERWTVTPAGATKVQITGTGVQEPPAPGFACLWR